MAIITSFIKGSKDVAMSSAPWGVSQGSYLLPRGGMLAQNQEEREELSELWGLYVKEGEDRKKDSLTWS